MGRMVINPATRKKPLFLILSLWQRQRATRTLYDEDGYPHLCVDEYMKRCLEIRLIQAIVKV